MHNLKPIDTQQPEAAFDRTFRLLAAEISGLEVAIGLGGQHVLRRQPAKLAEHDPNAPLALPIAVGGRRIQEVDPAVQNRPQHGDYLLLEDGVEHVWHASERRAADAEWCDT